MPTSLKGLRPALTSEGPVRRAPNAGTPSEDRKNAGSAAPGRPPGRGQRFLGNAPIRVKVVLITLVPLIAMFLFAGVLTFIVTGAAQSAQQVQQLARLGNQSSTLVDNLQLERSAAAAYVADPGSTRDHPSLKRFINRGTETELALREFLAEASRLDTDTRAPISSELQRISRSSTTLVQGRTNLITQARNEGVRVSVAAFRYQPLINDLLKISDRLASAADDRALSDQLSAAWSYSSYKEQVGQEQIVVLDALKDDNRQFTEETYKAEVLAVAGQEAFLTQFRNSSTTTQQTIRNDTLTQETVYRSLSKRAAKIGPAETLPFTEATWIAAIDQENAVLRGVEQKLNTANVDAAAEFRDDAIRKTIIVITAALAALVVALLVSLAVARSMVRPLVRLRSSALEVAYQSLPEVVRRLQDADQHTAAMATAETKARTLDIRSGDEIGQVAQAFNAVHLEAVRVASEQAQLRQSVSTMFVNLSRRSQLLVDRLIRLIDGLEQGERDPDRLSELFKLDHLATRMRRNDENLLVLAGADAGRRWTRPAPLVDVLRAATAEVEQYTRVKLGSVDDSVEISAPAVNDLVHLVAEVLENATSFSSPRTDVVVDSRRVGDHVVIEIEDQGIGMSREQLAEFNERLAKPPVFDIAVSRMMGLFVVGRLASRHGVKVMLRDASGGGVLAIVTLPAGVLHGDQPVVAAIPPASATTDDEQALDRPVERIASERIDRPEQPALPGGAPSAPAANAPGGFAPTAPFGAPQQPDQQPFSTPAQFGAPAAFNGQPAGQRPGMTPAAAQTPNPFAASAEPTSESANDSWRPLPFGPGSDADPNRDPQREAFGPPSRTPQGSPPGGRDLFGPPGPEPFNQPNQYSQTSQYNQPEPSAKPEPFSREPFQPAARAERDDSGARPAFPPAPTSGPFAPSAPAAAAEQPSAPDPSWSEPTRPVPVLRDPASAAATGTHRILGDLRPEQPQAEAREPDLTWSGGSGLTDRRNEQRSGVEEPTRSVANQPAAPVSPASQQAPAPLPVRDPFAKREVQTNQVVNQAPVTAPPPVTPPASPTTRPEPSRGSAADAMSVLRSEVASDRSSTTGPQKVFRAGPSDPPSSDPTIEMPLPIFEAIESEWFRSRTTASPRNGSNGSWQPPRVPEAPGARQASGRPDDGSAPEDTQAAGDSYPDAPVSPAVAGTADFPQSATAAWNRSRPNGSPTYSDDEGGTEALTSSDPFGPGEPVTVGASRQPAEQPAASWESPADAGWRAAQAAAQKAAEPVASSTTKSGLPKRVPMAHFVPGRVETAVSKKTARPTSHRSPEAVRGVLSSYRSGLEQGRQAGRPSRTGTTFAGSPEEQEEM